jgi:N-acetylglucosamine-6-phosphate deacetylase
VGRLLLRDAVLLDPEAVAPEPGGLLVAKGCIAARLAPGEAPPAQAEVVDLGGRWLAPGFIDLHFHGGLVFPQAQGPEAALDDAARSLVRHGTTAFLATTVAQPPAELGPRVTQLASIMTQRPFPGAAALGIHLEGPWINPEAAGAQPRAAIRGYDALEAEEIFDRGMGLIRMVTLAPEMRGAAELQAALARREIAMALGHSLASASESRQAIERGARHVTHLFNAMRVMHQREPGLAGVALVDDRLSFDLICDGAHVHPSMIALALRAKGEGLILITDRVDPPEPGEEGRDPDLGSGMLRDDGTALRLPDGRLGGSRLSQDRALRNARELAGMTLLDAVAACSLRPARVLGIESERGTFRPGARADFAVLDEQAHVLETWIGGKRVWRADS